MLEQITARGLAETPEQLLRRVFHGLLDERLAADAHFRDASLNAVIGVGNLACKAPVVMELLKNSAVAEFLVHLPGGSALLLADGAGGARLFTSSGEILEAELPASVAAAVSAVVKDSARWAGEVNELGEHVVDLRTPPPGPHFNVNLLMGNRVGFPHALQTTPKSVVDRLGRGAFRSHAATQVLATRWDMRQEENGFPANRQFYLVEGGKKLFYSAEPGAANIVSATCTHSQNHTVIRYETNCGLSIERTIFILPHEAGMPLATEVQRVHVENRGAGARSLRIVYTGMFGTNADHAVFEDVLYSNVIMQSRILRDSQGHMVAVSPDYYPEYCKKDVRFHSMLVRSDGAVAYPTEFCMNCTEFLGNGTLENPESLPRLSNSFYRKGPGFFALAAPIELAAGSAAVVDNFTGLVSSRTNPAFDDTTTEREIEALVQKYRAQGQVEQALQAVKDFGQAFCGYLQVESSDGQFDAYVNRNLPFQVLYQTFVSRSFCQTQKGQREIGFREIQDIFASMQYLVGMGMAGFVKDLLKEWCAKVFEFGFAYHNFFWVGKEPGVWSDDGLWFIQAASRYIGITGDMGFLDEQCEIAGINPAKTRTVFETMLAILRYSGEISVGKHCIPLLDRADWNDCLSLDNDYADGIVKEKLYRQQLEKGGKFGDRLESNWSESVMNGFLLKLAIDQTAEMAAGKGDETTKARLEALSQKLYDSLQQNAWKGDFFARVLLNRYPGGEYTYLGAAGDGLSGDPAIGGAYFLNSFNWAVLCGAATEPQIATMLDTMEATLKTPYGLKLMSPADLERISSNTATGHYFPGDRENGAVFKHASMMAAAAMVKAAKEVTDQALAERLCSLAWWMIDLVLPYRTMEHPYETAGNPRFCTQYNNSQTGENIGPMLSGTATWLNLTLLSAWGLEADTEGFAPDPVLRPEQTDVTLHVNMGRAQCRISITKPVGFRRVKDGNVTILLDGKPLSGCRVPLYTDGKLHEVEIHFQ